MEEICGCTEYSSSWCSESSVPSTCAVSPLHAHMHQVTRLGTPRNLLFTVLVPLFLGVAETSPGSNPTFAAYPCQNPLGLLPCTIFPHGRLHQQNLNTCWQICQCRQVLGELLWWLLEMHLPPGLLVCNGKCSFPMVKQRSMHSQILIRLTGCWGYHRFFSILKIKLL